MSKTELENIKERNSLLEDKIKYLEDKILEIEEGEEFDSNHYYRGVFLRNSFDVIAILDQDMHFILGTEKFFRFVKVSHISEISGKEFTEVFNVISAEWAEKTLERCVKVFSSCEEDIYNDSILIDDDVSYFKITIKPVIVDDILRGVSLLFNDITELYESTVRAETGVKIKSQFLAQISHEIRTPMNAIKGMSDLLLLTELDEIQSDYCKNIYEASHSLLQIINNILDFSKLEANKLELINHEYGFSSMINDVVNQTFEIGRKKNIRFFADISPDIPLILEGDEIRIKQVLFNFLSNALKYTNEGYVKFSVNGYYDSPDYCTLNFEVSDSGSGITSNLSDLFTPFTQSDDRPYASGSGLGLAISAGLLDLMGSEVIVDSKPEIGSTFSFSIKQKVISKEPLAFVEDKNISVLLLCHHFLGWHYSLMLERLGVEHSVIFDPSDPKTNGLYTHLVYEAEFHQNIIRKAPHLFDNCTSIMICNQGANPVRGIGTDMIIYKPMLITSLANVLSEPLNSVYNMKEEAESLVFFDVKVLLVDDNKVNLMVGEGIFKNYNIQVDKAENGLEAFEMSHNNSYDMIFMDHMMPIMNGIDATKKIREAGNDVPIIALSANNSESIRHEFKACGMDDVLSKPIELKEVDSILQKWLPRDKIHITPGRISVVLNKLSSKGLDVKKGITLAKGEDAYISKLEYFSTKAPEIVYYIRSNRIGKKSSEIFDILASLKELLYAIGAKDLVRKTELLIYAVNENNVDLFNENWNTFLDKVTLLSKQVSNVFNL